MAVRARRPAIDPILVINPNSSQRITAQILEAVEAEGVRVITSQAGPPAIESDQDVIDAVGPLLDTARKQAAAAVVVACFSDPGLDELRAESAVPVFGIAESALRRAVSLGERVGVISSVAASVPRHRRYWARLGVQNNVIADIPLGLGVLELDTEEAYARAYGVGGDLVAAGADVVVLGCTGMTHMRARLEEVLRVPVVDPCTVAVDDARRTVSEEAG